MFGKSKKKYQENKNDEKDKSPLRDKETISDDEVVIYNSDKEAKEETDDSDTSGTSAEEGKPDPRAELVASQLNDIGDELCSILEITENTEPNIEELASKMILLFPGEEKFDNIMIAKRGVEYTRDLLLFLKENKKYLINLKNDPRQKGIFSYDLKSKNGLDNFLNNVHDSFVISKSKITIDDKHLHDFLTISNFFRNLSLFEKQMENLEKQLVEHAKKMPSVELETVTLRNRKEILTLPLNDRATKKPFRTQKILSSFFYQWARDNHFNQDEYAKLIGFVEKKAISQPIKRLDHL